LLSFHIAYTPAAPSLFGRKFLPEAINSVLTDYPEARLNLNLSDEILNYAVAGIDVANRIAKLKESTMVARKLGESQRALCASPSYIQGNGMPSHPSDLDQHNCIIFVGEDTWCLRNDLEDERIRVAGRFEANSAEIATRAALDGLAIALRSLWDNIADRKKLGGSSASCRLPTKCRPRCPSTPYIHPVLLYLQRQRCLRTWLLEIWRR
jgi:DNA-binding transcriptional LysR family regulator